MKPFYESVRESVRVYITTTFTTRIALFPTPQRYIMRRTCTALLMDTVKKMTLRSEVKVRVFPKNKQKYLASTRLNSHHDVRLVHRLELS